MSGGETRAFGVIAGWRIVAALMAGLFIVLVAALVPPDEFGRFNLALSVLQVVGAVVLSWPNQALLRFGREEFNAKGHMQETLGARLALHGLLLVPALLLVWAAHAPLAAWIGVDHVVLLICLGLGLVFLPLSEAGMVASQAMGRFLPYGLVPVVQRLGQLGAVLALALGLAGGWAVLFAGTVAGYVLAALFAWTAFLRACGGYRRAFGPGPRTDGLLRLCRYGWSLPFAMMGAFLIAWMDLWFIRHFLDHTAVGIYAWAYAVTLLATTLLVPLAAVLAPRAIDRRLGRNRAGMALALERFRATAALAAALIPFGLALLVGLFLAFDFGPYAPALVPLLILGGGVVYQLAIALVEPMVYADERLVARMSAIVLAMVGVNAVLDIALIPLAGIAGAALATVSAYALGMVLQWRMVRTRALGAEGAETEGVEGTMRPVAGTAVFLGLAVLTAGGMALTEAGPSLLIGLSASAFLLVAGRSLGLFAGLAELTGPRLGGLLKPSGRP